MHELNSSQTHCTHEYMLLFWFVGDESADETMFNCSDINLTSSPMYGLTGSFYHSHSCYTEETL